MEYAHRFGGHLHPSATPPRMHVFAVSIFFSAIIEQLTPETTTPIYSVYSVLSQVMRCRIMDMPHSSRGRSQPYSTTFLREIAFDF